MLRRNTNSTSGKLRRLARQRGLSLEQLTALARILGWDMAAIDAAIARLLFGRAGANDNAHGKAPAEQKYRWSVDDGTACSRGLSETSPGSHLIGLRGGSRDQVAR
jgi:hypothetical protein